MLTIILTSIISFFTVFFLASNMKKFLERAKIIGFDQQKKERPKLATSAGVLVITGVLLGGFFFIGINTFLIRSPINLTYLLAAYCSIFIITFIGFLDDLNIARKPKKNKGIEDYRIGLKQWQKPLLTLPAAIPLMAVMAGTSVMSLPFFGIIDLGIIYPLLLIPIAVVVVGNVTNMLAGMNGLEAGLGFVSMFSLGLYTFMLGRIEASIIAFTLCFSLLAFLKWNWCPAKFLPGDSLTYLIGASFASIVIIGNIEKFGIVIFTPWIIEAFLKLRSKFRARSLGDIHADGTLKSPYKNIYSLTHVVMRIRPMKERSITSIIIGFEILICVVAFVFFI
ncbi:MAG: glycosyltransferase 4 family protein [Candidatus Aenigmarchaeota archaeon]